MAAIPELEHGQKHLVHMARELVAARERPQYARHAAVCLAASALLLLSGTWSLAVYFPAAFVLACRYHELAWYRTVRLSSWLFVVLALTAMVSVHWTFEHQRGWFGLVLHLAVAVAAVVAGCHLGMTQWRLCRPAVRRVQDDYRPRWACGGLLAVMPVLCVLGVYGGLLSWRTPIVLLWGLSAIPLLALQLRLHPLFPRLAIGWLCVWFAIDVVCLAPGSESQGDEMFLAAAILLLVAPLAAYLEFHPRVRDTFRAAPSIRAEEAVPVAPVLHRERPRPRGTSVPA